MGAESSWRGILGRAQGQVNVGESDESSLRTLIPISDEKCRGVDRTDQLPMAARSETIRRRVRGNSLCGGDLELRKGRHGGACRRFEGVEPVADRRSKRGDRDSSKGFGIGVEAA